MDYSKLDSTFLYRDSVLQTVWASMRSTDSTDVDAWVNLITITKMENDFERELIYARVGIMKVPYSSRLHFHLGDALLDNGLVEDAILALKQAIAIEPRYTKALTTIAEAYDMLFFQDSALLFLDSAISSNPRYVQAHFQKAEVLNNLGRRTEAVESYREWAALQPYKAEPWIKLGEAQCLIGSYSDAAETLDYALSLAPNSPDALYQYALAKQGMGSLVDARDAYVKFLFSFPTHKRALEAEEMARSLGWKP